MTKNLKTKWVSTATRGTSCKVFDSSTTIRSALLTLLIIPIEDVVYDLTQGAHPAIFNRHLTAPEDTEGDRRWQEFIDRARANSSSGTNSQRYRAQNRILTEQNAILTTQNSSMSCRRMTCYGKSDAR